MDQSHPPARSLLHVDTWVFDLDNTLYPARYNLFDLVDRKIGAFVASALRLDAAEARRVQKSYLKDYGTTLRGLMLNHGIDPAKFLDFVHEIDFGRVPASPRLNELLGQLDGRKLIFTNASTRHAEKVVERLGVGHHFEAIFDIADADFTGKPYPEAYAAFLELHEVEPNAAAMIDDSARNLEPAAALGMTTVWVRTDSAWGREGSDGGHIDVVIDDLAEWLESVVTEADGV